MTHDYDDELQQELAHDLDQARIAELLHRFPALQTCGVFISDAERALVINCPSDRINKIADAVTEEIGATAWLLCACLEVSLFQEGMLLFSVSVEHFCPEITQVFHSCHTLDENGEVTIMTTATASRTASRKTQAEKNETRASLEGIKVTTPAEEVGLLQLEGLANKANVTTQQIVSDLRKLGIPVSHVTETNQFVTSDPTEAIKTWIEYWTAEEGRRFTEEKRQSLMGVGQGSSSNGATAKRRGGSRRKAAESTTESNGSGTVYNFSVSFPSRLNPFPRTNSNEKKISGFIAANRIPAEQQTEAIQLLLEGCESSDPKHPGKKAWKKLLDLAGGGPRTKNSLINKMREMLNPSTDSSTNEPSEDETASNSSDATEE